MMKNIKSIQDAFRLPLERKWYDCDKCGQHLLIYEDTAKCSGVFVKCKRCGKEVEIKI